MTSVDTDIGLRFCIHRFDVDGDETRGGIGGGVDGIGAVGLGLLETLGSPMVGNAAKFASVPIGWAVVEARLMCLSTSHTCSVGSI